jgi:deazaflavin-dependent oxidoreductase (nitroreductase family)
MVIIHALKSIVFACFALAFIRAPRAIRSLNPLMNRLLRAGMPSGPNALLTVRGRASGLPRTFPVSILELGQRRFVQAPYGEVNWVRNLRVSGEAIVTKRGHSETVAAVELAPDVAAAIFRDALGQLPRSRLIKAVLGPSLRPPIADLRFFRLRVDDTMDEYVADARRHPTFELRRSDADGATEPSESA